MRLNDALNCGSPLVVSRGMGGVRLVDEYGCGLAFDVGDSVGHGNRMNGWRRMLLYMRLFGKSVMAASYISPRIASCVH